MYDTGFFITESESNNRFDYTERTSPMLYVPDLRLGSLEDVQIGIHTAIEADLGGIIQSEQGLQHFIFLHNARVPTWICDNHNHVFAFWHKALQEGYILPESTLVHIDQHTDLGTPTAFPMKNKKCTMNNVGSCFFETLETVEKYTNTVLTIADFIVPALSTGLISEALMITGEDRDGAGLFSWQNNQLTKSTIPFCMPDKTQKSLIVDLDLDYFSQGFDDKVVRDNVCFWLAKADIVTIATSPLFINQEKALTILKSLQNELILL